MKLLRKNAVQAKLALSDKAASWIANGILKMQKKFANGLGAISNSWKTKQQWIFLCLVCLVFGGLSLVAVIKPFNKKTQGIFYIPTGIKTPLNIHPNQDIQSVITDNEINQVHAFRAALDSLFKTREGRIKIKRLFDHRPGLLDSLKMVEQLYYLQKNEK